MLSDISVFALIGACLIGSAAAQKPIPFDNSTQPVTFQIDSFSLNVSSDPIATAGGGEAPAANYLENLTFSASTVNDTMMTQANFTCTINLNETVTFKSMDGTNATLKEFNCTSGTNPRAWLNTTHPLRLPSTGGDAGMTKNETSQQGFVVYFGTDNSTTPLGVWNVTDFSTKPYYNCTMGDDEAFTCELNDEYYGSATNGTTPVLPSNNTQTDVDPTQQNAGNGSNGAGAVVVPPGAGAGAGAGGAGAANTPPGLLGGGSSSFGP